MPTLLRVGPYRFFFYSGDAGEPMHVHVRRDRREAKFWLSGVRLAGNAGFGAHELRRIERIIRNQSADLEEAWHDFHGA